MGLGGTGSGQAASASEPAPTGYTALPTVPPPNTMEGGRTYPAPVILDPTEPVQGYAVTGVGQHTYAPGLAQQPLYGANGHAYSSPYPPILHGAPSHPHFHYQQQPYPNPYAMAPGSQQQGLMLAPADSLPAGAVVMVPAGIGAAHHRPLYASWWAPHPMDVTCPSCNVRVQTRTAKQTGIGTWLTSGTLCILGCLPCCLIPFCADATKDTVHSCPNCNKFLGMHKLVW